MLISKLVVDYSNLNDELKAGEITKKEYDNRHKQLSEKFKEEEKEAFEGQSKDIECQLSKMVILQ